MTHDRSDDPQRKSGETTHFPAIDSDEQNTDEQGTLARAYSEYEETACGPVSAGYSASDYEDSESGFVGGYMPMADDTNYDETESLGPTWGGGHGSSRPEQYHEPPEYRDSDRGRLWPALAAGLGSLVLAAIAAWALTSFVDSDNAMPATEPTVSRVSGLTASATKSSNLPPTPVSAATPVAQLCSQDLVAADVGGVVTVADCDGSFALIRQIDAADPVGLYQYIDERWEFFANPYGGACREDLERRSVPASFLRDFPPCIDTTASPTAGNTSSEQSEPTTSELVTQFPTADPTTSREVPAPAEELVDESEVIENSSPSATSSVDNAGDIAGL